MKFQLEKEKVFEQAAKVMKKDKVLIVCDRAALDNKVYMDEATFESVCRSVGANEVELRDQYDAVFHLVTAAKGAEEFYTNSNNSARIETVEQAAAMDDKFIEAWTGHPHLRVIDNSTDFTDKMRRLIAEISSFLGEPAPFEIERKYLIEYPDLEWLQSIPSCEKVDIIQIYLKVDENEEIRVTWNPEACVHAGACVRGNSRVFDPARCPWIDLTQAPAKEIASVIGNCPSGALRVEMKNPVRIVFEEEACRSAAYRARKGGEN